MPQVTRQSWQGNTGSVFLGPSFYCSCAPVLPPSEEVVFTISLCDTSETWVYFVWPRRQTFKARCSVTHTYNNSNLQSKTTPRNGNTWTLNRPSLLHLCIPPKLCFIEGAVYRGRSSSKNKLHAPSLRIDQHIVCSIKGWYNQTTPIPHIAICIGHRG